MTDHDGLLSRVKALVRSTLHLVLAVGVLLLFEASICHARVQDWAAAEAESVGLDAGLIDALVGEAEAGSFRNLHGLLVVKGGRLVVEEYFGDLGADDLHYTASVTKSVSTILLGMAMERGLLPGLDDGVLDMPLSELLPEYSQALSQDPAKAGMTLRHVLSMTGGLEWDEDSFPYNDPRNDWVRVRGAEDPLELIFQQPMASEPGTDFVYSGGMSTVVGYLLERATDGHPRKFAEEELFQPLGITEYQWWDLGGGLIDVPGGLNLRPRDMAKIGQLMLNGGLWDGKRIVSEEWVAETSRRHISNVGSPDYALHWWCGDFHYRARSTYLYMASGHGGQKIFVVPDFDMVIVLTHQVFGNPFGELNNLSILSRYLLPAADPTVTEEVPLQLAPEVLSSYAGEYRGPRGSFHVDVVDGALRLSGEGSPPMTIEPVGEARFRGYVEGLLEVYFEFDLDEEGVAQGGRATFGFTDDVIERIR